MMQDDAVQQAAYEAADSEENVVQLEEAIRQITLKALTERQLDKDNIKSVVESVVSGVTQRFSGSGDRLKPALQATLKGIDDALAKSAIAAKLAAEEALSKADKFTNQDIKSVITDLKAIEDLLLESFNKVAAGSSDLVASSLKELAEHMANSGTTVGSTALDAVKTLSSALEASGKQGLQEAGSASKDLAVNLAKVASGILAGMSEAIHSSQKSK